MIYASSTILSYYTQHLGCVDLLKHATVPKHEVLGRLGVRHAGEGYVAVSDDVAGRERLLGPGLNEVPDLVCGPVPDADVVAGVQEVLHHARAVIV